VEKDILRRLNVVFENDLLDTFQTYNAPLNLVVALLFPCPRNYFDQ
jgi:hypothetical protein